jgi:hypothetical protein
MVTHSNLNGDRAVSHPAARRSIRADGRAPSASISPWQQERNHRFHKICQNIAARIARGQSLHQAVTYYAWYYRGKFYHSEPARPIRLSHKTLIRIFGEWRAAGQSPEAFALGYRSGREKLSPAKLLRFVQASLAPGVRSHRMAHARCRDTAATASAYSHALPRTIKNALAAKFLHERRAEFAARKIKRAARATWKGAAL